MYFAAPVNVRLCNLRRLRYSNNYITGFRWSEFRMRLFDPDSARFYEYAAKFAATPTPCCLAAKRCPKSGFYGIGEEVLASR